MEQIPDDPIIRCMERCGYPPWMRGRGAENWEEPSETDGGEEDNGWQ